MLVWNESSRGSSVKPCDRFSHERALAETPLEARHAVPAFLTLGRTLRTEVVPRQAVAVLATTPGLANAVGCLGG
jgi:hypothetical protein